MKLALDILLDQDLVIRFVTGETQTELDVEKALEPLL